MAHHYARDIKEIETAARFISINADNILIDGKHRYLAYKKLNDGNLDVEIQAFRYAISSKLETFKLACSIQELGKSLSTEDKIESAKRMYSMGESSQAEIAKELHVSQPTVSKWLSRTLKEEKEKKKETAFSLWMACCTQDEIAESVEMTQPVITGWQDDFINKCQEHNFIKSADFDPPIYNVWKQQNKSNAVNHFGNSEPRWLENLLYLYTNPADIIVDPFAGSGSTIDLCKKRQSETIQLLNPVSDVEKNELLQCHSV